MRSILFSLLLAFVATLSSADTSETNGPVSIEEKTTGMQKHEGFFRFYWDDAEGKIWLELEPTEEEFLYVTSLPHGVGSNDIGLDRGQLDNIRVVFFRRVGPKVLLIQPNYAYRAVSDDPDERTAVAQSFAVSTLYGFEVVAETDDRVLVDATSFLLRDATRVSRSLKRAKQGSFRLDQTRSALDMSATGNFPDNTEISAMLTFSADSAGAWLRQVAPTPEDISVVQRHSFIRLPDDNYIPRRFDPRSGFFGIDYMDFATPIAEPIRQRFIARHRLVKKESDAALSAPVEPIIYYVDRGVPEPIRSALVEGASWWREAFEAAGYKDAFEVHVLPEGADPMDVRYNVIQWVHRATRGWSYGGAIIDPRTGEIIKGHVSLGSLRVRQDYLIAEGLLGPYTAEGVGSPEMLRMSLARLRQLSAHEVGHTLGLRHNFAASANGRASVMDYPYPYAQLGDDGQVDLSAAYDSGIGEWDMATIIYGYREFSAGVNETAELNNHLEQVFSSGLNYLSDADARSGGSASPLAHLWDNGSNAVDELNRIMKLRRHLLDGFAEKNLAFGRPMAMLEQSLVPIYMFHRYQIAAASKVLGGLEYDYSIRDGQSHLVSPVAGDAQRLALEALLETISPEALALPETLIELIPPHTIGYRQERESFRRRTGATFDPLAAAETAADLSVSMILQRHRAARLVEYHSRDTDLPGLGEVVDKLVTATFKSGRDENYYGEIARVVDNIVVHHLIALAADQSTSRQVQAIAFTKLKELADWIEGETSKTRSTGQRSHLIYARSQIDLFLEDPSEYQPYHPVAPPAGSPIGADACCFGNPGDAF